MLFWLIGFFLLCCFLPAIIGTLLAIGIISLIAGPFIILGLIGFVLIFRSFADRPKPFKPTKFTTPYKPITVKWRGQDVPLGILIYSIISSVIIAPIIIIALLLFCPYFISIPLVFITIGVEMGRHSKNKPKQKIYKPAVNCGDLF